MRKLPGLFSKGTHCLSSPSVAVMTILTSQLKKEGLIMIHSSRLQSVMVGESWQQEPEVAGHTIATIRRQKTRTQDPTQGTVPPAVGGSFHHN